jgi:hypothetical protein
MVVCSGENCLDGRVADQTVDMAMAQALALTEDLKLGWYTSIPPREMFACQIIGTTLGALANCMSRDWIHEVHEVFAYVVRCDARVCYRVETAVSRWVCSGSYSAVDGAGTGDILLC